MNRRSSGTIILAYGEHGQVAIVPRKSNTIIRSYFRQQFQKGVPGEGAREKDASGGLRTGKSTQSRFDGGTNHCFKTGVNTTTTVGCVSCCYFSIRAVPSKTSASTKLSPKTNVPRCTIPRRQKYKKEQHQDNKTGHIHLFHLEKKQPTMKGSDRLVGAVVGQLSYLPTHSIARVRGLLLPGFVEASTVAIENIIGYVIYTCGLPQHQAHILPHILHYVSAERGHFTRKTFYSSSPRTN